MLEDEGRMGFLGDTFAGGIGLNPSPHIGKNGDPLYTWLEFMGRHHGLTPNRLLSVFFMCCFQCVYSAAKLVKKGHQPTRGSIMNT